ncbi:hypothetical protein [Plantactinospora sonchi]|uniref:Uncharacterized protein n=1 Tax=Plantactinospora sonchi TaxID=1544735 RepID=A0ABU7S070_9ACTN
MTGRTMMFRSSLVPLSCVQGFGQVRYVNDAELPGATKSPVHLALP